MIKKARTRPIEVEAVKWAVPADHPKLCGRRNGTAYILEWCFGRFVRRDTTPGDYIVTYPDGTIEVCKPDEFERKFEVVE